MKLLLPALTLITLLPQTAQAEITRIWLTHRTSDPSKIVVSWESAQAGRSVVKFAAGQQPLQTVKLDDSVTLHHVEIPLVAAGAVYRYQVQTGDEQSTEATFKSYPTDELRVAVVADWQGKPKFDAILKDDIHLLCTAGDNISSLHGRCGVGVTDCVKPYSELIAAYPELFRSVPFMPALGNHDREIRPRGNQPPAEPVYDVDATAFRKFFELPGDEWKWHFDVPALDLRIVALDLNHIQDQGTTWQTCHPFHKSSEQFQWYEKLMTGSHPARVVTLHNENSGSMRNQLGGAWGSLFRQGTIAITGFGYYAERAEADGFPYYNTALGVGAKYPDRQSKFFESVASYVLITVTKEKMTVQLKSLDGRVLDTKEH